MIEAVIRDRRLILSLNRSEKANALTRDMLVALRDAVMGANRRDDLGAIILTGVGKVFSAGADLDEVKSGTLATDGVWEDLSGALADSPLMTIAALNGALAGGAMGMALACDLRLSVPAAQFFYPVMKMGVLPQPSDPGRLAALVGPSRAKLILMAAARLTAEEALRIGLIDRIDDDPLGLAMDLSDAAAAAKPGQVAAIKALF